MSFSGVEFAFFFPLVFLLYWVLPRRAPLQNAFLLLASYFFYYSWSPRFLALLVLSTAVDYGVGRALGRWRDAPPRRRLALAASLLFNLGVLAYFKYAGFFAESLNRLLTTVGLGAPLPVLHLLLPLGISFYTFQKLAYIIDVYYERLEPCRSPLQFATFVAFFPQLIAGPIVRGSELLPQLAEPRRLDAQKLGAGVGIFFLGFIKKAYIADYLGQWVVDPVFAHPDVYGTAGHWVALLGYAIQVFCDFSGYSEMAIGCGRLLGIELPVNFNYPFFSKGMLEMWRRWHITLNTWLFDYIYGPLTTGQGFFRGRLRLGFVVVFLASGLWHGARWTFLLWGLLHGLALVVQFQWGQLYKGLCRRDRVWVARRKSTAYAAAAWTITQLFFLATLVPFRAPTLAQAGAFARALLSAPAGRLLPLEAPPLRNLNLLVCLAFFVGYHLLERPRAQAVRARLWALPSPLRGAAIGLAIAYLLLFVPISSGTFIYAQF